MAARTSARGGSCMPTSPRNVSPCSSSRLACKVGGTWSASQQGQLVDEKTWKARHEMTHGLGLRQMPAGRFECTQGFVSA